MERNSKQMEGQSLLYNGFSVAFGSFICEFRGFWPSEAYLGMWFSGVWCHLQLILDMATSRLFRKVVAGLAAHMRIILHWRACRPHLNHKARKLPIESSSSVAVDRDCKMSTGSRQAVAKLCAARPLRFHWQIYLSVPLSL